MNKILAAILLLLPFVAAAQEGSLIVNGTDVKVEKVIDGLAKPWGIDFLPDGRLLVTLKKGKLHLLGTDGKLSDAIKGTPDVFANGQGGLLDVAVDENFDSNGMVYLTFAEHGPGSKASTALGKARLNLQKMELENWEVIFSQQPKMKGDKHFGSRVVLAPDNQLFLVLGERFKYDPAQDLGSHLGKVIRINRDGSVPNNNPFMAQAGARPEIYSYGHRNIEAAAIDPQTGKLWVAEMGPLGGDELNQPEMGKNYGWPIVSWGKKYSGEDIPDPNTRPEFADVALQWTPVISPSGMIFYTGSMFPQWRNLMFIGGLSASAIVVVKVEGTAAEEVARLPLEARIRDIAQSPDGSIYFITDAQNGGIFKLVPLEMKK